MRCYQSTRTDDSLIFLSTQFDKHAVQQKQFLKQHVIICCTYRHGAVTNLLQPHDSGRDVTCPAVVTSWTHLPRVAVPHYDALEDGCKGRDTYARTNQNGMLCLKDVA